MQNVMLNQESDKEARTSVLTAIDLPVILSAMSWSLSVTSLSPFAPNRSASSLITLAGLIRAMMIVLLTDAS